MVLALSFLLCSSSSPKFCVELFDCECPCSLQTNVHCTLPTGIGFPQFVQEASERGVMQPQARHIVCDP
jgi:hypothetical protein